MKNVYVLFLIAFLTQPGILFGQSNESHPRNVTWEFTLPATTKTGPTRIAVTFEYYFYRQSFGGYKYLALKIREKGMKVATDRGSYRFKYDGTVYSADELSAIDSRGIEGFNDIDVTSVAFTANISGPVSMKRLQYDHIFDTYSQLGIVLDREDLNLFDIEWSSSFATFINYDNSFKVRERIENSLKKVKAKKEYKSTVDAADNAYYNGNYERAKELYMQAWELMPDENYSEKQIAKINEKLKEAKKQTNGSGGKEEAHETGSSAKKESSDNGSGSKQGDADEEYRKSLRLAIQASAVEEEGDKYAKMGSFYQAQALQKYQEANGIFYTDRVQKKINDIQSMQALAQGVIEVGGVIGKGLDDIGAAINEGSPDFHEWDFNYHFGVAGGFSGAGINFRAGTALYAVIGAGIHKSGTFSVSHYDPGSTDGPDAIIYGISLTKYYLHMGGGINLPLAKGLYLKPEITFAFAGNSVSGFDDYIYDEDYVGIGMGFVFGVSATYMIPKTKIGFGLNYMNMGLGVMDHEFGSVKREAGKKAEALLMTYGDSQPTRFNSIGLSFIVRY